MIQAGHKTLIAEALLNPVQPPRDEWWRGAMFYEVYLRSFMDSNGDGIGDLSGLVSRLDYIKGLNVDGLWLSPFYPSPQKDFGYDVTDLCAVDPIFGTLQDFDRVIAEAHRRDLAVLIDIVPCHTSDEHDWFIESRSSHENDKADWYIWSDSRPDGGPPNNWLSSFGGPAWTWEPRRSQYYYHPFLECQPCLNLRNPAVLDAMLQVFRFWLDRGVDGFRLDAIQCLTCDPLLRDNPACPDGDCTPSLGGGPCNPFRKQLHYFDRDAPESLAIVEAFRDTVRGHDPERVVIGELADIDSTRTAVKYTRYGERLHAVYDFDLINAVNSVAGIRQLLQVREDFLGTGAVMNVFTNHDSERAVSTLTGFAERAEMANEGAKLLLFLQSTLRGGGILFQGEELGLTQPTIKYDDLQDPWGKAFWPDFSGRDGVRTPLPWEAEAPNAGFSTARKTWLPVAERHVAQAIDVQRKDPDSVLSFVTGLLAWRRNVPMLRWGDEAVVPDTDPAIIAYDRFDSQLRLTFVLNFSLQEVGFDIEPDDRIADVPGTRFARRSDSIILEPLGFCVFHRKYHDAPKPEGDDHEACRA